MDLHKRVVKIFESNGYFLTMISRLLGVVGQVGQVNVGVRGHLLPLPPQIISIQFMAPHRPHRVKQGVLVFTEAQDDVDAVNSAPDA